MNEANSASNGKQNMTLDEQISEAKINNAELDFDSLEKQLEADLEDSIQDIEFLEDEKAKINDPESLGKAVGDVIWDQLMNQVACVAGEDFVKENKGFRLDLRDEAHIQTTENFANGKIATHNTEIDYQKRYDDWQSNFQRNEDGSIKTQIDSRTGEEKAVLRKTSKKDPEKKNYNTSCDADAYIRDQMPHGSKTVHKDHTVPAAEIIRDAEANAHLSRDEQAAFANSDKNIGDLDSRANESKGDSTMTEWLDSERDGKKPAERYPIDEEKLREKDREAREEYAKRKKEGERKSYAAGKKSQKEEALRIGGKAARAVLMNLLMEFLHETISKLVMWLRSVQKTLSSLLESLKAALHSFIHKLKTNLLNAGETLATTVADAIWGPIVGTIKKFWMMLKQGGRSLKEAISFLRDPANEGMSFEIKILQVGKIVVAGLTAGGAIVLGEAIEKLLMGIPGFGVQIPLLGSLANIMGIFLGAVVAGILGAIAIRVIEKRIESKLKADANERIINKGNEVLNLQKKVQAASEVQLVRTKMSTAFTVAERHTAANNTIMEAYDSIEKNNKIDDSIDEKLRASSAELDHIATDTTDQERKETSAGLDDLLKELMEDN